MDPLRRHHNAFQVAGLTARTTNRNESDPAIARIGKLWNRFFDEEVYRLTPGRTGDRRIFGVYSGYASDVHGAFDVTVGVAVASGAGSVIVEAGNYLVFEGQGEMPQMVIAARQRVWRYFETHPEIVRCYRSDFEAFERPDKVAIHIGVS